MKTSLRDMIYEKLRESITYGKLFPGERLVEDDLAKQFKSSRSPVREALRLLEAEGLITFERNKGITVAKLSIKQVEEIYDLLLLLESYAARAASMEISDTSLNRLRTIHEKLKVAAKSGNLTEWFDNNYQFHNFFFKHCGNDNLIKTVNNLKRKVHRYDYLAIGVPGDFETFIKQHEAMLQGCEKRDGAMVERYMSLHMETVKVTLINHLRNHGISS
jgi:DNA-binding GntR family transcriptional regulator